MAFKEFTVVCTYPEYSEVMIDIDVNNFRIVDMYCYSDNVPIIENEETGKVYKISLIDGKNPLFKHIKNKSFVLNKLIENGAVFITSDDENEYLDEIGIIDNLLTKYGISKGSVPYSQ